MVLAESVQPGYGALSVRALGEVAYPVVRPFQRTDLSAVGSQQDM
jgi:hypothetical protein